MPTVPRIACFVAFAALTSVPDTGVAQSLARPAPVQTPARGLASGVISAPPPAYADYADLVLRSPVVLDSVIRSAVKLTGAQAVGTPPGMVRLYVEADVMALVRGRDGVPGRIGWILDVVPDARGKLPNLRKARVLVFARPIAGRTNQLQLTGADSQRLWSAAADALTRRIITETIAVDAPPRITAIGNAFHVAGTLPGAGETQIFLQTENRRPVSLNVIRQPGEAPRWAVALSEIVDESAAPPPRDTLLWYRLACGLPASLPAPALQAMEPADQRAAAADYQFVLTALGPCTRG